MKNKTLLIIFLLFPHFIYSQFDYETFKSFKAKQEKNKSLKSIFAFEIKGKNERQMISKIYFNQVGLPDSIIQFREGTKYIKKIFQYGNGQISKIETFRKGELDETTEFDLDEKRRIKNYTEYVYSSYDGKKLVTFKTILHYYQNGNIRKKIKLRGHRLDTNTVSTFHEDGRPLFTYYSNTGKTVKKAFVWNDDLSEMKELNYEKNNTVYDTVLHFYKNKLEIKRIDNITSKKPLFWKYDGQHRLIETNQNVFIIQYFEYNKSGFLIKQIIKSSGLISMGNSSQKQVIYYEYHE